MKQLYSEKEILMTSNKSLAEYNLSQEPMLKQKRQVNFNSIIISFPGIQIPSTRPLYTNGKFASRKPFAWAIRSKISFHIKKFSNSFYLIRFRDNYQCPIHLVAMKLIGRSLLSGNVVLFDKLPFKWSFKYKIHIASNITIFD